MDLDGTRVALTGAAAGVVAVLGERLEDAGAEVVAVDRGPGDPEAAAALAGADAVVHAAPLAPGDGSMSRSVEHTVRGTRDVLDAARGRVVHVGSVAGWGCEFRHELPEDAPPRPCGVPWIDAAGAAEDLALARGACVVRSGDVYGPRAPGTLRAIAALRAGRLFLPRGGAGLVAPVFVDDLADAVVRALAHPGAAGRAYTAWDGHAVSAAQFFGCYARMLGRDAVPERPRWALRATEIGEALLARARGRAPAPAAAAPTCVSRRATYLNLRARRELGWEPRVSLADGMARTERWLAETGMFCIR
jgi:nucleoside-diphosphate-sugar epimerase